MTIVTSIFLLYLACALLYQAGVRRTTIAMAKNSGPVRLLFRLVAIALFAGSLWLASVPQGWERGIAVWLGLVSLAALASLLVAGLRPQRHAASAVGACLIAAICGCVVVGGGVL